MDLIPQIPHLLSPQAQAAELAGYVHYQRKDQFDVLRSRPESVRTEPSTGGATFDAVHDVLAKYYRLIVVDSGNDEASAQWKAMIQRANTIVVPTTTRPEHAESARLLLEELASTDQHSASLADTALVVVSQASRAEPSPGQLVETFKSFARDAVGIPYDVAMAGRPLLLDSLAPATRRAWLAATAAMARTLT